jgi:hypothetical protein
LFKISLSPRTPASACQPHGTQHSDFGTSKKESLPRDSSLTLRTFSPLLSLLKTDKLHQEPETTSARSGIPLETASTQLNKTDTLTGFHALDSHPTPRTPSLSLAAMTRPSRSGTRKPCNSRTLLLDTPRRSQPSLWPPRDN